MARVTCPYCEEYTAEKPTEEQAANSVIAHASSKKDENHRGVGYQKARERLNIEPSGDTEGGETVTSSPSGGHSGGAMDPPTPTTDGGKEPADDPDCPECGNPEWYPVDEVPDDVDLGVDRSKWEYLCVNPECREVYNA